MKQNNLLLRLVVLVAGMLCALGASAAEAYACYTPENSALTFYYDNHRSSRSGTTYDLNTSYNNTGWATDGTYRSVTLVVFDPMFAYARPTTTWRWFSNMENLQDIIGINYLNTSEVTNMGLMFNYCEKLTSLDLSHFNTSKVTDMYSMFWGCKSLTSLDLSHLNTSKVTDMYSMFGLCNNLHTIVVGSGWSTAAVESSSDMFLHSTNLKGGKGTAYDASHVDKTYAHIDGGTSNPGYLTAVGTEAYACYTPSNTTLTFYYDNYRSSRSGTTYDLNMDFQSPSWCIDGTNANVTKVVFAPLFSIAHPATTYNWFYNMQHLESITGLSYLNTSEVTNMSNMFYGCSQLTSLDLSGCNTSQVTNMSRMFRGCTGLASLDVSSFNTTQVTTMGNMFYGCNNLRTIYVGDDWSTAAVTYSSDMFWNCTSLVGSHGTTYDANHVDKTYAHIDGGTSNPGYLTDKNAPEAYACYTPSNTTLTFYYDKLRSSRSGTTYDLNTGGNWPDWYQDYTNESVTKVVFNSSFANARPTSTYMWFYKMKNLISITGLNYLNTSEVTNMSHMFYNCKLTSLNVSNFNTVNVTDMSYMFYGCSQLTSLNVSNFNTVNVTDMVCMFELCSGLTSLDVSHFNTAKVTNMAAMFYQCNHLASLDVSNFNTSRVTNMENMFYDCSALTSLDLSSFNTASATEMRSMFQGCSNLADLDMSNFNTSQVTDMKYMFFGCTSINRLDLGSFNTSRVTDMTRMFRGCNNLHTIYVGTGWSTAAVTASVDMFYDCTSLVGGMGTTYSSSNPTDKTYAHIDHDIVNPGYFTAAGTEAYACYSTDNTTLTFYYDTNRNHRSGTVYSLNEGRNNPDWVVDGTNANVTRVVFDSSFAGARPTTTYEWFDSMKKLYAISGINYLNTSEVTNMAYMFFYCSVLTNVNLSQFNTAKVTSMHSMFYNCYQLVSLNLSSFNTSNVTDMHSMFYNCSTLKSLDLSSFNTTNVTNMRDMFNGCIEMTSLNLGSFNTSKVTNMQSMFSNCNKLQTIYAGNDWSTAAVTSSSSMFNVCSSLVGGKGTTYDASNPKDKTYAHIDGGPSNPGYLTLVGTEAYACFTPADSTVTFYYDNLRNTRSGTTYNMNTNSSIPGWTHYGNYVNVAKMVFDPSFAAARPTSTYWWFYNMTNLKSITGLEYLNTSEVTHMDAMFTNCKLLTSLDLSSFNTSKVVDMTAMFSGCTNLRTIYVGDSWSTAAVTSSSDMFWNCTSLVGGKGTTYNESNPKDKTYAHIDGGTSNPGYFTDKNAGLRGDADGDGSVNIADVSALIDYLLNGNASSINLDAADVDGDSRITIGDVSTLIDYLLSGHWNS